MAVDGLTQYAYVAIAADGTRKKGKIEADSASSVADTLTSDGMIPIEITEFRKTLLNMEIGRKKGPKDIKLKPDAVVSYARQLHLLLRAGLSMPRAIAALGEDVGDARIEKMFQDLSERTLAGVPLSKALEDYPGAFDEIFRSYIAAGEATGNIEQAVERLARMLAKGHQLRLKIKSVTAYPKLVSYAIILLVFGILMFLVPMYARIYDGFGQKLPAPTLALVKLSSIMSPIHVDFQLGLPPITMQSGRNLLTSPLNFASPLLWGIGAFFAWREYRKRTADDIELGMRIEKLKFRIPVLGKLNRYNVMYRWSSTMAGALSAGLQTFTALDLAGRTAGSYWISYVTEGLKDAVRSGRPLSSELAKHPDLFYGQLRAMAATGEEAGEPATMFENVASTLEDELEAMVATLGAKIEVLLLLVMGVVVGTLLVILYLPILNLSTAASEGLESGGSMPAG